MPWYSAFGNHDALVQGNSPDAYVGPFGTGGETSNPSYHQIVTGCLKPVASVATDEGGFFGSVTATRTVPSDPRRCFLAKDQPAVGPPAPSPCAGTSWIGEHFETTGEPIGHGFAPSGTLPPQDQQAGYGRPFAADLHNDGYYSFSPREGLRFVVLDTVTDECGTIFCSEGSVDDTQFRWLEDQILRAEAMGQYVIVFSHHTLRTTRFPSSDPTEEPIHWGQRVDRDDPGNPQPGGAMTLEELFCLNDRVIAHVNGHEHRNFVRHHRCEEDSPPTVVGTGDFWEVSTAAHVDWPQQARMIELIDNGDGTMSMVLTILDHAGPPNPGGAPPDLTADGGAPPDLTADGGAGEQVLRLSSIARELAFNDYQGYRGALGGADRSQRDRGDRPAVAVRVISRTGPRPRGRPSWRDASVGPARRRR
jgi:hypothetical protein